MSRASIVVSIAAGVLLQSCATPSPSNPPGALALAADTIALTADVVYGHKDGMALFYDVFTPPKPNGAAVLFMVSGGLVFTMAGTAGAESLRFSDYWIEGSRSLPCIMALRRSSRFPMLSRTFAVPVRHVSNNAVSYHVDPNRLGVWGGSAGGHLALMLGLASDNGNPESKDPVDHVSDAVKAVVAYYPPVDLRRMTGPSKRFPRVRLRQQARCGQLTVVVCRQADPPTLIVHGYADTLVPIASGRRFTKR